MKEFNYLRCWREHYAPAVKAAPDDVRRILEDLAAIAPALRQDPRHLSVIIPDEDAPEAVGKALADVKAKMEEVPPEVLAEYAEVIHNAGHFAPSRDCLQEAGLYWKFKHLADENLIDRGNFGEVRRKAGLKHDAICKKFHDHKEGTDLDDEEVAEKYAPLGGDEFKVEEVRAVNYKPHPFVIGLKHFPKDGGIYLDPKAAPCAHPHCNLSYDEHTYDRAMILSLKRDLTEEEARKALQRIVEATKADKVRLDGFTFRESQYKFLKG